MFLRSTHCVLFFCLCAFFELNANHGQAPELFYKERNLSNGEKKYEEVSGKSSQNEAGATHIRGMEDDKIPLYATPTSCRTTPGRFNIYLLEEDAPPINGRIPRAKTGVVHYCVTETECYFGSAYGWGYNGKSSQTDGNTPAGVFETFPITEWPSHWGRQTPFYLAAVASTVEKTFTLVDRKGRVGRNDICWHHKERSGKSQYVDDYDHASAPNCRTAGCPKSKHVNSLSPAGSVSILSKAQVAYEEWKKNRLQAYNAFDSKGKERRALAEREKDQQGAIEAFKSRMPGKKVFYMNDFPKAHDNPANMAVPGSDSDHTDWRKERFSSVPTIVTEHKTLRFNVEDINKVNGQALQVKIGEKMVNMCDSSH